MIGKYVFSFSVGDGKNKKLLGGKGANLCEMTQIGLNVPPGFVISTEACLAFLESENGDLPEGLMDDVREHVKELERPRARSSAIRTIRCSFRYGPGPLSPCPA